MAVTTSSPVRYHVVSEIPLLQMVSLESIAPEYRDAVRRMLDGKILRTEVCGGANAACELASTEPE